MRENVALLRLLMLAVVCVLLLPLAAVAAEHRGPAPADEYFGRLKESILGIRNHLNDFERKRDFELARSNAVQGIDNLEDAIEDWHAQYPRDPWLPRFLNRVVRLYARCHDVANRNASNAIALLQRDYAATAYARDAMKIARAEGKRRR